MSLFGQELNSYLFLKHALNSFLIILIKYGDVSTVHHGASKVLLFTNRLALRAPGAL